MTLGNQMIDGLASIFDQMEESMTLRTVTITRDSQDDTTESTSDSTINGVLQITNFEDVQELGGILEVGDAILFTRDDVSTALGKRVIHNSVTYEIDQITPERVNDVVFYEALLRKIVNP